MRTWSPGEILIVPSTPLTQLAIFKTAAPLPIWFMGHISQTRGFRTRKGPFTRTTPSPVRPDWTAFTCHKGWWKNWHINPACELYWSLGHRAATRDRKSCCKEGNSAMEDGSPSYTGRRNQGQDPTEMWWVEEKHTILSRCGYMFGSLRQKTTPNIHA